MQRPGRDHALLQRLRKSVEEAIALRIGRKNALQRRGDLLDHSMLKRAHTEQ
jgi:hypothetical protein